MNIVFEYKNRRFTDFLNILEEYSPSEFDSPYRSTVPFLQYWRDTGRRLTEFVNLMALNVPPKATLSFEHRVAPPKGKGNSSQTDLMILTDQYAVGVEAKYTEPRYQTVEKWLGTSSNKRSVLEGWLDLVRSVHEKMSIRVEDILDLPYQLIHRCASVCSHTGNIRIIVYQCFDVDEKKSEYYRGHLNSLKKRLGSPTNLWFMLVNHPLLKSDKYSELQLLWDNGKRRMHEKVLNILRNAAICEFRKPDVTIL
ncbi:MAG TPA: hypothetical protein ENI27_08515 [bacterium]|nr:hypothetical protein [bacterium]